MLPATLRYQTADRIEVMICLGTLLVLSPVIILTASVFFTDLDISFNAAWALMSFSFWGFVAMIGIRIFANVYLWAAHRLWIHSNWS